MRFFRHLGSGTVVPADALEVKRTVGPPLAMHSPSPPSSNLDFSPSTDLFLVPSPRRFTPTPISESNAMMISTVLPARGSGLSFPYGRTASAPSLRITPLSAVDEDDDTAMDIDAESGYLLRSYSADHKRNRHHPVPVIARPACPATGSGGGGGGSYRKMVVVGPALSGSRFGNATTFGTGSAAAGFQRSHLRNSPPSMRREPIQIVNKRWNEMMAMDENREGGEGSARAKNGSTSASSKKNITFSDKVMCRVISHVDLDPEDGQVSLDESSGEGEGSEASSDLDQVRALASGSDENEELQGLQANKGFTFGPEISTGLPAGLKDTLLFKNKTGRKAARKVSPLQLTDGESRDVLTIGNSPAAEPESRESLSNQVRETPALPRPSSSIAADVVMRAAKGAAEEDNLLARFEPEFEPRTHVLNLSKEPSITIDEDTSIPDQKESAPSNRSKWDKSSSVLSRTKPLPAWDSTDTVNVDDIPSLLDTPSNEVSPTPTNLSHDDTVISDASLSRLRIPVPDPLAPSPPPPISRYRRSFFTRSNRRLSAVVPEPADARSTPSPTPSLPGYADPIPPSTPALFRRPSESSVRTVIVKAAPPSDNASALRASKSPRRKSRKYVSKVHPVMQGEDSSQTLNGDEPNTEPNTIEPAEEYHPEHHNHVPADMTDGDREDSSQDSPPDPPVPPPRKRRPRAARPNVDSGYKSRRGSAVAAASSTTTLTDEDATDTALVPPAGKKNGTEVVEPRNVEEPSSATDVVVPAESPSSPTTLKAPPLPPQPTPASHTSTVRASSPPTPTPQKHTTPFLRFVVRPTKKHSIAPAADVAAVDGNASSQTLTSDISDGGAAAAKPRNHKKIGKALGKARRWLFGDAGVAGAA
ncbi:hypothetical protein HK104_003682 [Borealophlyctis nickersoniae]|nr:hypothetical protein HK104_003682 [Borealophlyctis nickersoniae]